MSSLVNPDGTNAVDRRKAPELYRAVQRGLDFQKQNLHGWARVAALKAAGQLKAAATLVRDLLGVHGDPMDEETKAELRARREAMSPEEKRQEARNRRMQKRREREACRATGREQAVPQVIESKDKEVEMKSAKRSGRKSAAKKARAPKAAKAPAEKKAAWDPRLPNAGSTISKDYHDRKVEVKVLDEGGKPAFELNGERFGSLSAVASKVTGAAAINGFLFFGLTKREPASASV